MFYERIFGPRVELFIIYVLEGTSRILRPLKTSYILMQLTSRHDFY